MVGQHGHGRTPGWQTGWFSQVSVDAGWGEVAGDTRTTPAKWRINLLGFVRGWECDLVADIHQAIKPNGHINPCLCAQVINGLACVLAHLLCLLQCHLAGHVTTDDAIIDEPNIRHKAIEVPPGCGLNVMEVRHG